MMDPDKGTRKGETQPPLRDANFDEFKDGETLDLFLLAGQSNMKGKRGLLTDHTINIHSVDDGVLSVSFPDGARAFASTYPHFSDESSDQQFGFHPQARLRELH